MAKAREVMDRLTAAAVEQHDLDAVTAHYTDDAVMLTPDAGEVRGLPRITEYWGRFLDAFPDVGFEVLRTYETGEVAINEGWWTGTNTQPLTLPTGAVLPATGQRVRFRDCHIATVIGDRIREHHLYFDQLELMTQLGLTQGQ
jgi:predicted ester cyclase